MRARFTYEWVGEIPELTKGQEYAVNFLKSIGLELMSTPRQLKRGTLFFRDDRTDLGGNTRYWAIYRTGYVRSGTKDKMVVCANIRPSQYEEQGFIDDEEYKELAHIVSSRVLALRKRKKKGKEFYGELYNIDRYGVKKYKDGLRSGNVYVPLDKMKETVNRLRDRGNQRIWIFGVKTDHFNPADKIEVRGENMVFVFTNSSNEIGFDRIEAEPR